MYRRNPLIICLHFLLHLPRKIIYFYNNKCIHENIDVPTFTTSVRLRLLVQIISTNWVNTFSKYIISFTKSFQFMVQNCFAYNFCSNKSGDKTDRFLWSVTPCIHICLYGCPATHGRFLFQSTVLEDFGPHGVQRAPRGNDPSYFCLRNEPTS